MTPTTVWRAAARRATDVLLDLLYPPACVACGALPSPAATPAPFSRGPADADAAIAPPADTTDGHKAPAPAGSRDDPPFCIRCRRALIRTRPPFCRVCGELFPKGAGDHLHCSNCSERQFHFRFARAAYQNRGPIRELIHRFKYNDRFHLRLALGALLDQALEDPRIVEIAPLDQWLLVPVPLHPRKQRKRGYNQSEELCRVVARRRGLTIARALRRLRFTGAQAGLGRDERLSNLQDAFALHPRWSGPDRPLAGRHVLLVDDVFTTGATTEECARVLTGVGGVQNVVAVTVARG